MRKILLFIFLYNTFITSKAQNVGIGTTTPNVSAILDVTSTNKGILIPRVSSFPSNPATGLLVYYNNDFWYYNGTEWKIVGKDEVTSSYYLQPADSKISGATNDSFGISIAKHQNYYLVGAPGKTTGGAVYAGHFLDPANKMIWVKATVDAADALLTGDGFGTAVACGNNYEMIAGAPYRDNGGINRGAIYYDNNTSDPSFTKLTLPTINDDNDNLGASVAMSNSSIGTIIVAGAPGDDGGYGAVHTYFRATASATPAYEYRLIDGSGTNVDKFGSSVAVSIDNDENAWLFVGAPGAASGGTARGKVIIYKRNTATNTWTFHQTLSGVTDDGQFGYSLSHARSGTKQMLTIGQPGRTFVSGGVGGSTFSLIHVYTFDTTGNSWTLSTSLSPSGSNQVGESICANYASNGNPVIVSGHSKGMIAGYIFSNFGTAYYYEKAGNIWGYQKLFDVNGEATYNFGKSCYISSGKNVLIGSPGTDINGITNHGKITIIKVE